MNQDQKQQIKLSVESNLDEKQTPGAAIAIYINGQPCLETGIGHLDLKQEVKLPTDAKFYIYSITKTILAIATLHLVNEKRLNLDTPIAWEWRRVLVSNFTTDPSITLRQILSHTSGLPDYGAVNAYFDAVKTNPSTPWSEEAYIQVAKIQGLQFAPGQSWGYSNIGYLVLKCILEEITGLSMQELLKKLIFDPLSLQNTFVANNLDDVRILTPGYSTFFSGDELQDITPIYHPGWVAHGVVVSTVSEVARIIDALFTGKLLDCLLVEEMLQPASVLGKFPLLETLAYGMGLFLGLNSTYGKVAGHVGEGPGYSVAAFHFPNLTGCRVTIAALANRDRHDLGLQLVFKMVRALEKL